MENINMAMGDSLHDTPSYSEAMPMGNEYYHDRKIENIEKEINELKEEIKKLQKASLVGIATSKQLLGKTHEEGGIMGWLKNNWYWILIILIIIAGGIWYFYFRNKDESII